MTVFINFPFLYKAAERLPPQTAKSASRASPGPLTTHPMMAILGGEKVCQGRLFLLLEKLISARPSSTSLTIFFKSISVRPQVGQEIIIGSFV